MSVLIGLGEVLNLRSAGNALPALRPDFDNIIETHRWLFCVAAGIYILVYIIPVWIKKQNKICWLARRSSNCSLFILVAAGAFLWVAHTGGLTSLYGAAYLSLFSIAVVVPKSVKVKILISVPVGVGAFALAAMSKNTAEYYMCFLSIFGSFLGVTLQAHLNRSEKD